MHIGDTIVAISSAAGPAARMIVRIAGPDAQRLVGRLSATAGDASTARQVSLQFDGIACPAWLYTFLAPRSYTGDDLLELHIPGNPLLARTLVETLIAAGARSAEPGEFTARAFLNGRIDLAAAEGVALTIAATHADELRAARQLLAGELSRRLADPLASLTDALALLESNIDFAEEDIAFIDAAEVRRRVAAATTALDALVAGATQFERLSHEPTFVLVGLPNAGKSTLLNTLAGQERAVVSPVAGTTRDALSAEVALPRGLVHVIDVAGLENAGDDEISPQMQQRARQTVEEADFVIEVRDGTADETTWLPRAADLIVETKADLLPPLPSREGVGGGVRRYSAESSENPPSPSTAKTPLPNPACLRHLPQGERGPEVLRRIKVSAVNENGMDALRAHLDALAFGASHGDSLALTARHFDAVARARTALSQATHLPDDAIEMIAHEIRTAVDALGQILGQVSPDDVLGRVFATFCVGK